MQTIPQQIAPSSSMSLSLMTSAHTTPGGGWYQLPPELRSMILKHLLRSSLPIPDGDPRPMKNLLDSLKAVSHAITANDLLYHINRLRLELSVECLIPLLKATLRVQHEVSSEHTSGPLPQI